MEVESWRIDKPIPYARNARKLSGKAVDKIAASIKEFGWRQPIVVDKEGVIICGHTRLLAAKKLGLRWSCSLMRAICYSSRFLAPALR